MACSSGCPSPGSHRSWGECVRSKRASVAGLESTGSQVGRSYEKAFDRENDRFAQAVRDGLNPESVTNEAVEAAYRAADLT